MLGLANIHADRGVVWKANMAYDVLFNMYISVVILVESIIIMIIAITGSGMSSHIKKYALNYSRIRNFHGSYSCGINHYYDYCYYRQWHFFS